MARVDRLHIGIFGRTNAGKSTLMNVLTQQPTSLEDPTPGTTADAKTALMQVHGLGAVKLFDTAGLDEGRQLGEKKREKTWDILRQVDIAVIVVDPQKAYESGNLVPEQELLHGCEQRGCRVLVVCNVRESRQQRAGDEGEMLGEALRFCGELARGRNDTWELTLDLKQSGALQRLIDGLQKARPTKPRAPELFPFLRDDGAVLLHIPLDEQAPEARVLRPQQMAIEYLLRRGIPIGIASVDLQMARSGTNEQKRKERDKFIGLFEALDAQGCGPVQFVVTDSQAIDLMAAWLPDSVALTSFSVMMIHQSVGPNLVEFAEGARGLDTLCAGDKVLIAEACNHDRIAEDIGTVQIPRKLKERINGLQVDHTFGREFPQPSELSKYKLVIHCGGCMISRQQVEARMQTLMQVGLPVTNYGMVLSWLQGHDVLQRVLAPWRQVLF